ncbi:hypothetical protein [Saccharicrinis aurantiacus]|uniref:hypothetical protein n=1 Tax=Saccharicrinis aurantiacus TaxID=1849719 RepID=UPI0024901B9B|nr:hypothetical protein [Saccharicrinis aurantiacus]
MPSLFRILLSSLFVATLSSCLKQDYSEISQEYIWKPVISVPFFTQEVSDANYIGDNNFIYDYVNLGEVIIGDTLEFDYSTIFNDFGLEQIMFRFFIRNGYPAELNIQANYLDGEYNTIKTLFSDTLKVDNADVDSEGDIIDLVNFTHDEYVNQDDLIEIESAKHISVSILLLNVNNSEEVIAKLEEYEIELNMGVRAYIVKPLHE